MTDEEAGYKYLKRVADGRYVAVTPLTFGRGRVIVGTNILFIDNGY